MAAGALRRLQSSTPGDVHSTIASIQYLYSLLAVVHVAAAGGWGRIEAAAGAEARNPQWEELLPTLKEALRSHERLVVVWHAKIRSRSCSTAWQPR